MSDQRAADPGPGSASVATCLVDVCFNGSTRGDMVRWLMIVLSLLGLFLALTTRSPGVMGLSLVMLVVGLFGIVLSVAAGRISANARPDITMLPPEALVAVRAKARERAAAESTAAAATTTNPQEQSPG